VALDSTAFLANVKGFFFIASGAEMTFTIMSQVVIFQDTVTTRVPFFVANGTLLLVGTFVTSDPVGTRMKHFNVLLHTFVMAVVKRLPWR
jgi:hypothetical protein